MKGISEERLRKIARETHDSDDTNMIVLSVLDMLIGECEELSPWKPIDENTPKDKWLLIIDEAKDMYIGKLSSQYGLWYADIGMHVVPTYWQELPTLPEEEQL